MESLKIAQSDDAPLVNFDVNIRVFTLAGESRPENASKFYSPIIKWMNEYFAASENSKNKSIIFVFKLDYFNSSSAKYIMDIILLIKKQIDNGYKIEIEWHYDARDEDMMEAGKEFSGKFSSNIEMKMIKF